MNMYMSLYKYIQRAEMALRFTSSIEVTFTELELMKSALKALMTNKYALDFINPVNWQSQGLDDYPKIIEHPMDLTTIASKLSRRQYSRVELFFSDIDLIWTNCLVYNRPEHFISSYAIKMQKQTVRIIKNYFPRVNFKKEKRGKRKNKNERELSDFREKRGAENKEKKQMEAQQVMQSNLLKSSAETELYPLELDYYQEEDESRETLLDHLSYLPDDYARMILLTIQKRCPSSSSYESNGDIRVDLLLVDPETIQLALLQIQRWNQFSSQSVDLPSL